MGLVQAENIQVIAEAYDVALDISFPKGTKKQASSANKVSVFIYSRSGRKVENQGGRGLHARAAFAFWVNANGK